MDLTKPQFSCFPYFLTAKDRTKGRTFSTSTLTTRIDRWSSAGTKGCMNKQIIWWRQMHEHYVCLHIEFSKHVLGNCEIPTFELRKPAWVINTCPCPSQASGTRGWSQVNVCRYSMDTGTKSDVFYCLHLSSIPSVPLYIMRSSAISCSINHQHTNVEREQWKVSHGSALVSLKKT